MRETKCRTGVLFARAATSAGPAISVWRCSTMMTGWVLVACVAGVGSAARAAEAPIVLHVAPEGQDAGSGRADDPFATITRARDEIRALKTNGEPAAPITVRVHGGRYFIDETIAFGPRDSGTAQSPITYEAASGETPVLCGGRLIEGFKTERGEIMVADIPEARDGGWIFRRLFVDGESQIRARYPNVDPTDRYRKGFAYTDKPVGGFGASVSNIHNSGDWMEYRAAVPADGDYAVWVYYGALNEPFGRTDMGGRTALSLDGAEPIPLMDLPDTGGWRQRAWSRSASLTLSGGEHVLRWTNLKGGGLDLEAFALTDDLAWRAEGTELAEPAAGKHVVVIQAEDFLAFNGKQLRVGRTGGSRTEFRYREGDIKPSWLAEPDPEVHIFQSGNCRAYKEIVTLATLDETTRTATLSGPECTASLQVGDRYFVENLRSELDSPGEWYLDTVRGRLHYWPHRPLTDESEVIAPVVKRLIEVSADADKGEKIEHLRFVGLTIEDTDYLPDDGCAGWGLGDEGVIHLVGATDCSIERCRFRNVGRAAVCLEGARATGWSAMTSSAAPRAGFWCSTPPATRSATTTSTTVDSSTSISAAWCCRARGRLRTRSLITSSTRCRVTASLSRMPASTTSSSTTNSTISTRRPTTRAALR